MHGSELVSEQVVGDSLFYREAGTTQFSVAEVFKGSVSPLQVVNIPRFIMTCGGGRSEYSLVRGETYLIYASRSGDGSLTAVPELASSAAEDVGFLRSLPAPGTGGRLSGRLYGTVPGAPIAGVAIEVSGAGTTARAMTDGSGRFEFRGLPEGTYSISASLSNPFCVKYQHDGEAHIFDRGCSELDISVGLINRLEGRAVDVNGRHGRVTVILEPVSGEGGEMGEVTGKDGNFDFASIEEGSYLLFVKQKTPDGDASYYYPGVKEKDLAAVIEMKPTTQRDLGEFILPAELTFRTMEGTLLYPDGTPVSNMTAAGYPDIQGGSSYASGLPIEIKTDADGHFVVECLTGSTYKMTVFGSGDPVRIWQSQPLVPSIDKDTRGLRVILALSPKRE